MRFLLTRPQEDNAAFAKALAALGHEVVLAPLQRIEYAHGPDLDLAGFCGILATSANGVRALCRRTPQRDLPLFAVGPQTAAAAAEAGFAKIECAHGAASDLAGLAAGLATGTKLIHPCGADAKTILAPGCEIVPVVLYRMIAADALPPAAVTALKNRCLDGVFVFSPRGAEVLRDLVLQAGLGEVCTRLDAYCISEAAAKMLIPLGFAHYFIAEQPNRAAMLAMMQNK